MSEDLLKNDSETPDKQQRHGIDALISGDNRKEYYMIDIDKVIPNPAQPRLSFDDAEIGKLAESIKSKGILQPIVVRAKGDKYEIVLGERRWRASKLLNYKLIPAIVKPLSDQETLEVSIIENIQREDLNPIEKAKGFKRLVDQFDLSYEALSQGLGISTINLISSIKLLLLPQQIQDGVTNKHITLGQAKALLSLPNENAQMRLFDMIIEKKMTVKDTEHLVSEAKRNKNESIDLVKTVVQRSAHIIQIEGEIQASLGCKVKIKGNDHRGRLEIRYSTSEDFQKIILKFQDKSPEAGKS